MIGHDADEFVAAKPRQDPAIGQQALDARRGGAQNFVAGLVAVKVVDLFEIVEIDSNCRQRLFAALEIVEQVAQRSRETAAVMAAGQMVEIGQTARFFLGCAAGVQFVGQRLVALPAEQDQRDIEQQGIG